jgi:hypothetical protein
MGKSARPLSLPVAAQKFNMTVEGLQALIDSGECSIGDVKGTIMCSYDTATKEYTLQRKTPPPPPASEEK